MAYIVLALGVLMSIIGFGAILSGYPIIEVERGWATVISGSVLLSGGLVTIALGIVGRILVNLVTITRTQREPALEANTFASTDPAFAPAPQASRLELPPRAEPRAEPPGAFAAAAPIAAAVATEQSWRVTPEPTAAALTPAPTEPMADLLDEPAYEPAEPLLHDEHPPTADLAPSVDRYELQSPSTGEHDLGTALPQEPPALESDADWLDQAFSAFDYEVTGQHPPAPPPPESPQPAALAEAPPGPEVAHPTPDQPAEAPTHELDPALLEDHGAAEAEASAHDSAPQEHADAPADVEAPATEPEQQSAAAVATKEPGPSTHDLTVIGRYDSDGTSYVMYSDGSIEAQSEAGVYRFNSMAELKAFIEG